LRTLIIVISLILVSILSIPLYLIDFIIGRFSPVAAHMFAQNIVRVVFIIWLWVAGAKYTVYGLEKVPADEPVLYIANHRSFFDVLLGYAYVPGPTSFVSKKSIKKIPCIAQWMYFLRCIFLDRDDIKNGLEMIKSAISNIEDGYSVFISPEGTRNSNDELLPFKEGCFRIATRTNCKIIPVCYTNTEKIFEDHLPWIRKTSNVTIEFGEPIDISDYDRDAKKHLGVKLQSIIQEMYNERRHL